MSTLDTQLAAAEQELQEIQTKIAIPVDPAAVASFTELARLDDMGRLRKLQAATERRDRLRERAANAAASLEQHSAAEAKAGKQLDKLNSELERSAKDVVAAVKEAEKALTALLATAEVHDAFVRNTAAELHAQGLPLVDQYGQEYSTGGDAPASGAVRIAGRWWLPVRPDTIFMRVAWGTARAVLGDRHDLTRRLHRYIEVDRLESRPDGLLDGAPLKPARRPPATLTAHGAPVESLAIVSDFKRADLKELEEKERQLAERRRQEQAKRYAENRAELVRKRGEEYVADLEARMGR